MKNYVKEGQELPMFGIGPYLICGIGILTAAAVVLCNYVFRIGISGGIWIWIFRTAGTVMILFGIAVWFIGAVRSDMDDSRVFYQLARYDDGFKKYRGEVAP